MRGHATHMWMCAAMVVGALGAGLLTGDTLAFLPVVGCVLMMTVMMLVMGRMGGRGRSDR